MNLSIFDNDGTLGAVAYETARFAGSYVGSFDSDGSAQRDQINANGWGVVAWSSVAAGGFSNVRNYTVSIRAECGMNKDVIALGIKRSIEDTNALTVTCRFLASSGCPRPDLIAGGSTVTIRTPNAAPVQTIRGGNVATVNVPISFDDDPKAGENIGFLDTLKGLDTTTMVLIGLAAVLVLKRL